MSERRLKYFCPKRRTSIGRLGKQFYRLPNIRVKAITDIGLDKPTKSTRNFS
jgi:hypothetical protein